MSNVRPLFADLHPSPVDADAQFDLFWQHYPRKVAKAHARAMWRRLSATERAAALAALPAHVAYWTARATPPEHIPHAGTWLNPSTGRRWEDELPQPEQAEQHRAARLRRMVEGGR